MIQSILNGDFSSIPKQTIQQSLIEYYSKRNPSYTFKIPHYTYTIEIDLNINEKKNGNEVKVEMINKETQTTTNLKYEYIYEIKDKRNRRSESWKIYKSLCEQFNVTPKIKYPDGDFKDYINLCKEIEKNYGATL